MSDLAGELGRDPITVSHRVSRLADDELIERERDGRTVLNDLAAAAKGVATRGAPTRQRPVATE